ncbi:hypothetical protein AMK26_27630 [Streptomyces sp. CB03234]|uniref:hypothetical protein n=1 Tax=Streptomyces sp. (strain CB03234) TaxID=1703937 RepID=UPI0009397DAA|nr:hypothetical protein [Streptomyces sp. CB03234]OKJ99767.1 hypothetical protein AMK26_27630 [Streptomyces sp. CB03234]
MRAVVSDLRVVQPDPTLDAPTYVDVPAAGAFVLIMRDDTAYCVEQLCRRLSGRSAVPPSELSTALTESYRAFQDDLRGAFRDTAYGPRGIAFHVVDAHQLERSVRRWVGGGPVISLDPLVERAARPLRVSRGFLLGGRKALGLVPRPDADPIGRQITTLLKDPPEHGYTLVEDDVSTGATLAGVIRLLQEAGVRVRRAIPGIRLAGTAPTGILGVAVDPVLQYRAVGGAAAAERVMELTDPRNFLLGASGLVVRLPDRTWGRAPYWLPFVSTTARVGLAAAYEKEFALSMLEANRRFFARAGQVLGRTVRVADLHPATRRLLVSLGMASLSRPVCSLLEGLGVRMDRWIDVVAESGDRSGLDAPAAVR